MKQFEYTTISATGFGLVDEFNKQGAEGWEYAGALPTTVGLCLLFKREKVDSNEGSKPSFQPQVEVF